MNTKLIRILLKKDLQTLMRDILFILGIIVCLLPIYYWEKGMYFTILGLFAILYPALSAEFPGHFSGQDFSWKYYHMLIADRGSMIFSSCLSTFIKALFIVIVSFPYFYHKLEKFNYVAYFAGIYLIASVIVHLLFLYISLSKARRIYIHYGDQTSFTSTLDGHLRFLHEMAFYIAALFTFLYGTIWLFTLKNTYGLIGSYVAVITCGVYLFYRVMLIWDDELKSVLNHLTKLPYTLFFVSTAFYLSHSLGYWSFPGTKSNEQLIQEGNLAQLRERKLDLKEKNCGYWKSSSLIRKSIEYRQYEVTSYLVEQAKIQDSSCDYLSMSMNYAASDRHIHYMKVALDKGANINIENEDGQTAIFRAGYNGHHLAYLYLIKRGAKVDHKDKEGRTFQQFIEKESPNFLSQLEFYQKNIAH